MTACRIYLLLTHSPLTVNRNSLISLTQPTKNMSHNHFQHYHEKWISELRQLVNQLNESPIPPTTEEHQYNLTQLVHKTMAHYSEYYRVKSSAAKQDVLSFFSAPWTTALERSLQWIGGWRPTTAFHLVYTESSILFESHVVDILRGYHTGDLGDLSPGQFRRVSELQCDTVNQENDVTDELADWQDGACDIVGINSNVDDQMERLVAVLQRADQLRLKTIESLVELLTPQQAAQFLVAAAELHFGIRGWGIEQDRQRENVFISVS